MKQQRKERDRPFKNIREEIKMGRGKERLMTAKRDEKKIAGVRK